MENIINKNILVTGVGGDIGQSIIKCLQDIKYHSVLMGCDIDGYAAGKKVIDEFYKAPLASDEKKYLEFIKELIIAKNIHYIIPSTEQEIKFFNTHRNYYDSLKTKILINNSFIIETFSDKYETAKFFEKYHFPFPKTFLLSEYQKELDYPFLLKSREGAGSKGVFTINNEDELLYFRKTLKDAIIQEKLGSVDEEYTVGVFSDGKKAYYIAFRRYLGLGSLSRFVELVFDDKIEEFATKIAKLIELKGSINIQLRKVNNKYYPFEINPRLSSTVYFRHFFGFEDVKWWIDLTEGKENSYSPKYNRGIGVRTLGETFFDLEK